MNRSATLAGLMAAAALMALGSGGSSAQTSDSGKKEATPDQHDMAAEMEEYARLMSPGEHHKKLDAFVGTWRTVIKMWWAGPGTPPVESAGKSEIRWVLDGRFLLEEHDGEMKTPSPDGELTSVPYKGIGLTGYDTFRNLYIGSWSNNMSTAMLTMKGTCDPSGKVFTSYGEMDEPSLNVIGRIVKYVHRVINDDKHVLEIYDLHAGDDYKVVEVVYTRAGK